MWARFGVNIWQALVTRYPDVNMEDVRVFFRGTFRASCRGATVPYSDATPRVVLSRVRQYAPKEGDAEPPSPAPAPQSPVASRVHSSIDAGMGTPVFGRSNSMDLRSVPANDHMDALRNLYAAVNPEKVSQVWRCVGRVSRPLGPRRHRRRHHHRHHRHIVIIVVVVIVVTSLSSSLSS
jgi:hypothetical protein